jgi:predicted RNase H-like HicB family nuclease
MEKIIIIHIEKLPEGFFLATSDDIQGLVAQGRTIAETIEIARDVAKKLIESGDVNLILKSDSLDTTVRFDYPIVIGI